VIPDPIRMIKTSGKEDIRECSGYCRHNVICSNNFVTHSFFVHELFHIISQNNPELQEQLYNSLGFFKCNDIEIPTEISHKTLTNPDAQTHDVIINVKLQLDNTKTIQVTPVLFYDHAVYGTFFDKVYIKLMQVTFNKDNNKYEPFMDNDKCKLYEVKETIDFFSQIGNCRYYFHPDEILATYFRDLYFELSTKIKKSKVIENITFECDNAKHLANMTKIMFGVSNVRCLEENEKRSGKNKRDDTSAELQLTKFQCQ